MRRIEGMRAAGVVVLVSWFGCLVAQSAWRVGAELQAYPTGLIPGLSIECNTGEKASVNVRLGYQYIRHGDAGRHDDERGHGWGFTLGYRRHAGPQAKGWFAGVRSDVWFNTIEWTDAPGTLDEFTGKTKIVVVQPTLEGGYKFGDAWFFSPALAFGYEINVHTEGSPTGEGPILLAGISIGRRL